MTDAPKRIWATTGILSGENWYSCKVIRGTEYHLADLSANLVRAGYLAGLEAAAGKADYYRETCGLDQDGNLYVSFKTEAFASAILHETASSIRALDADREAIAAIVARVTEGG